MECTICKKHRDFELFTGKPIAELGEMVVSHFPVIDGAPVTKGRLLIEPRRHITGDMELTEDESKSLGLLINRSMNLLIRKLGAEHVYVFRINDVVAHFHFHVIARFPNTPKEYWGYKITEWPDDTKLDLEGVKKLSSELSSLLKPV